MKKSNMMHISVKNIKKVSDIFAKNMIMKNHITVEINQKDTVFVYKKQSNDYIELILEMLYHMRTMQNVEHSNFYMTLQKQQIQNILNISVFSNELKEVKNLFLSQQDWNTVFLEKAITYVENIVKKNDKLNHSYLPQRKKYFWSENIEFDNSFFYSNYEKFEKFQLLYFQKQYLNIKKLFQEYYQEKVYYKNSGLVKYNEKKLKNVYLKNFKQFIILSRENQKKVVNQKINKVEQTPYYYQYRMIGNYSNEINKIAQYYYNSIINYLENGRNIFLKYFDVKQYNNVSTHHSIKNIAYRYSSEMLLFVAKNNTLYFMHKNANFSFIEYNKNFSLLERNGLKYKYDVRNKNKKYFLKQYDNIVVFNENLDYNKNIATLINKNNVLDNIFYQNKSIKNDIKSELYYFLAQYYKPYFSSLKNNDVIFQNVKTIIQLQKKDNITIKKKKISKASKKKTNLLHTIFYYGHQRKVLNSMLLQKRTYVEQNSSQQLLFNNIKKQTILYYRFIKTLKENTNYLLDWNENNYFREMQYLVSIKQSNSENIFDTLHSKKYSKLEKRINKLNMLQKKDTIKNIKQKKILYSLKQIKIWYRWYEEQTKKIKKDITKNVNNVTLVKNFLNEIEYYSISKRLAEKQLYYIYNNSRNIIEKTINDLMIWKSENDIHDIGKIKNIVTWLKLVLKKTLYHLVSSKNFETFFQTIEAQTELAERDFISELKKQLYILDNYKKREITKTTQNINILKQKRYLKRLVPERAVYRLKQKKFIEYYFYSKQKRTIQNYFFEQNNQQKNILYYLYSKKEKQFIKNIVYENFSKYKRDIKEIEHNIVFKKWNDKKLWYTLNKSIEKEIIKNRNSLVSVEKQSYLKKIKYTTALYQLNYDKLNLYYAIQREKEIQLLLKYKNSLIKEKEQIALIEPFNPQKIGYYLYSEKESKTQKRLQELVLLEKESSFNKIKEVWNQKNLLNERKQSQKIISFVKRNIARNFVSVVLKEKMNTVKQRMMWNQENFKKEEIQQSNVLKNRKEMLFHKNTMILLEQSNKQKWKQTEQNEKELQQQQLKQIIKKEVEILLKEQLEQQQITLQNYTKEIIKQQKSFQQQFDKEKLYQQVYQKLERTLQHEKRQYGK